MKPAIDMVKGALCTLGSLAALSQASEARADEPAAPRSRFFVGSSMTLLGKTSVRIDGSHRDEGSNLAFAFFDAGYLQRLLPHFGLQLGASLAVMESDWSAQRNESRTRFQLAAGPAFVGTLKPRSPTVEWRVALPVGYTRTSIESNSARLVEESYTGGSGLSLSLLGGLDIMGKHHGGYFNLGYALNLAWLKHSASLYGDPTVHSQESYRFTECGCRAIVNT